MSGIARWSSPGPRMTMLAVFLRKGIDPTVFSGSRRGWSDFRKKARIRRHLVHWDPNYPAKSRGEIFKLDSRQELLAFAALGYTSRLDLKALTPEQHEQLERRQRANAAAREDGFSVRRHLRGVHVERPENVVTREHVICVPFVTALHQKLLGTLLLSELADILENKKEALREALNRCEQRLPADCARDRQSRVRLLPQRADPAPALLDGLAAATLKKLCGAEAA